MFLRTQVHMPCISGTRTACSSRLASFDLAQPCTSQSHHGAARCTTERAQRFRHQSVANVDVAITKFPAPEPACFINNKTAFCEHFVIRGYEVGPDQSGSIVTMANLIQEIAGNHAVGTWGRTDTGFASIPDAEDIIFVMTRLQLRMTTYPKWGDVVRLETWFGEESKLSARRDWVMTNAATGEFLGAATSTWVTINRSTRRLTKLPELFRERFMQFSPQPTRHSIPIEETKRKLQDMEISSTTMEGPKQVARRSDMDMNGHINNVTYLAWTLETVPSDIYQGYSLSQVEMDFKAECKAGDVVDALANSLTPSSVDGASGAVQFLHTLRRCDEDGCQELVRARTTWVPKAAGK